MLEDIALLRGVSVERVLQDMIEREHRKTATSDVVRMANSYSRFGGAAHSRKSRVIRDSLRTDRPDTISPSSEPEIPEFRRSELR